MKETICYYTDFLGNILGKLENDASNIGHVTFTVPLPSAKTSLGRLHVVGDNWKRTQDAKNRLSSWECGHCGERRGCDRVIVLQTRNTRQILTTSGTSTRSTTSGTNAKKNSSTDKEAPVSKLRAPNVL